MIDQTLAHYRITAKLGQGGMGEVYRATDTKLNREVAVKVLPESFAQDKGRLARFDREAKALASLNHPHIAGIYGLEQSGPIQALILELVDGEDLSERLKRGPLAVEEALDVCKQIAEALEAAHEKGIIHRDLKPGNVKLTGDGKVKVLDFGLAKAVGSDSTLTTTAASMSPTLTADSTLPGTLLGTAAYMSPEQARAKGVDRRSDNWSFGCVLFECLTGRRLFQAEDIAQTLAKIIESEPDLSGLPENTPPAIQLLLRKCLVKDPKLRLQHIGDARVDLEQTLAEPHPAVDRPEARTGLQTRAGFGGPRPAVLSLVVVALLAAGVTWFLKPTPAPPIAKSGPVRHMPLNLGLGPNEELLVKFGTAIRMSPNEETLAYMVRSGNGELDRQLYVKHLNELDSKAEPLPGTAGIYSFCFSPDGKEIAFLVRDMLTPAAELKIISIQDRFPRTVQKSLAEPVDVDWSDDSIIFGSTLGEVLRISLSSPGANPEALTELLEGEATHQSPQLLAGGSAVLYTAHDGFSDFNQAKVMIKRLPDGDPKELKRGGYNAQYLSSGHLVYLREGRLFVAAFNENQLTLREDPVPLGVDEVLTSYRLTGHFDLSPEGTLVYLKGRAGDNPQIFEDTEVPLCTLDWVDRQGTVETLMPPDYYQSFKLSPDGRYLAYALNDGTQSDINVYDIVTKIDTQLTSNNADEVAPIWSPDNKVLVFSSNRDGNWNLYWARLAEPKKDYRLTDSPNFQVAESWNPKAPEIALMESSPLTGTDIRIVRLEGSEVDGWSQAAIEDLVATDSLEYNSSFSPDGDWLVYGSGINKQAEIFVRPYPLSSDLPMQVSNREAPSFRPRWSTAELCFGNEVAGAEIGQIYRVPYRIQGGSFIMEPAVEWPEGRYYLIPKLRAYDLDPSGQRVLVRKRVENQNGNQAASRFDRVVLFENFTSYLKKKVPTGKPNP